MHREATTYSLFRICRTSVRITLAMLAQLVTPMTMDSVHTLASPRIACKNSTRSKPGTLRKISVKRIISVSSHTGAMPLTEP